MSDANSIGRKGILLRAPEEKELPAASALCMRSKGYWGYDAAFMEACRDELTLTKRDLVESTVILAVQEQTIAGIAQVTFEDGEAGLDKLFIEPDMIGHGIGRLLFDWTCAHALAEGATSLTVTADPDAAPFYEKMGFARTAEEPSGSIPGRVLPVLSLKL
ncbi:GNAT family N-acetyltransferase [uncultured Erythrobacter sp.]|uniref:GNAT family N-acetyltransferase n=1 Tax=uncultured Erythrobacter sp. TaxID=263913 RepID=UPI00262D7793|nr:GNAT family N-acetyltransferase [uncultured Erythrobacter sp.]